MLDPMNFDIYTYIFKVRGVSENPSASICSSLNGCLFTVETTLANKKNANAIFLNHKK